MVIRAGSLQRFSSVFEEAFGEQVRRLPGVREVFPDAGGRGIARGLRRVRGGDAGVAQRPRADAGMPPGGGETNRGGQPREIMLGKVLAQNLNKPVDDTLEVVPGEPFRVVGIYDSFNVFENGSIVMALEACSS